MYLLPRETCAGDATRGEASQGRPGQPGPVRNIKMGSSDRASGDTGVSIGKSTPRSPSASPLRLRKAELRVSVRDSY